MKKFILRNLFAGLLISLGFFGGIILLVKAAGLTATTGEPLTVSKWTDMTANFFWGSGSGGIYYNGKVGIGTNLPNKKLHIYDTSTNAEIDLQSVSGDGKHWGIYQDATSQELRMRNSVDRVRIGTGGNLNTLGAITAGGNISAPGVCIAGDCKTAWSQVGSSISTNYTGTCDSAHKGATGILLNLYKICDGANWVTVKMLLDGSAAKPSISCYQILTDYPNSTNGLYWLDLNGGDTSDKFQAYCDMTNGGWTLVSRMVAGTNYLVTSALGTLTAYNQSSSWKFSDTIINAIPKNTGYKLACGSETRAAIFPTTCVFQGASVVAGTCDTYGVGSHYVMQNYSSGTPYMVIYGHPSQNSCRAGNTAWGQSGRVWVK